MNRTISNRTFKWLAIATSGAIILFLIFFLLERKEGKQPFNNTELETDSITDYFNDEAENIVYVELPPKIIYKDTVIYKEKIVYKDTVNYKQSLPKIEYKDKIIYQEKIVYRDTVIYKESPPKIEYRDKIVYQDKIIYKEAPEPFHPYGKGNGKITLFKACNCYHLKIWIDGEYAGQTKIIFSSSKPVCGQSGTVSKVVLSGKHHITAKDEEGHTWDFYLTVNEDQCLVKGFKTK